jgi:hypothetical protein
MYLKVGEESSFRLFAFVVKLSKIGLNLTHLANLIGDSTKRVYVLQRPLLHCKKRFAVFPSPAEMSLTKLSQDGNN